MKKMYALVLMLLIMPSLLGANSCKDAGKQCHQDCLTLEGGNMQICHAACALAYFLKCGISNQTQDDQEQDEAPEELSTKGIPQALSNEDDKEETIYRFPRLCASIYRACRGHCGQNPGCAAACDAAYQTCLKNSMFQQARELPTPKNV